MGIIMKISMEKMRRYLIIFVIVACIVVPVSVNGQSGMNSTGTPTTAVTGTESPVMTPVAVNTTTVPVTNTTTVVTAGTTTPPVTTPVTVSMTTTMTPVPTVSSVTPMSTGDIMVASSPLGASILIDGAYYGTTPGNVTGLPAGNHIVRLSLSGYYDYEGTTYVVPGQVMNVFGNLPPLGGAVVITAPVTMAQYTTTAPVVTVQPTQTSSPGPLDNPAVLAGVIGVITACIGAGATLFSHYSKIKKD